MSEENSLTLDLTKENSSLLILPQTPSLSSNQVGWHGIQIKHYHQLPPHQMPEYYPMQHVIVTHSSSHPFQVRRKLDGRQGRDRITNGDIVLVPANISHGAVWDTEISITVLMLEPKAIACVAHEFVEPDSVELVPHFSKFDGLISQIILALKSELETGNSDSSLYAESMAVGLSAHLLRHYSTRKHTIKNYSGGLSSYKLKLSIEYINEHLAEGFSLEAIAKEVGMSKFYFTRMFKQSTGMTPHQYLVKNRLDEAKRLLASTDLSISEIAYQTGFASQSHLTRLFRKHLSITPKDFKITAR